MSPFSTPASQEAGLYHQLRGSGVRNIRRSKLKRSPGEEQLSSGQFRGTWTWGCVTTDVALKSLNSEAATSDLQRIRLLHEAATMAQFKHPNILTLYGVVSIGEPVRVCV